MAQQRVDVYLDGVRADTSPDVDFAISYSINQLQDVKSRQGAFSNDYTLPYTATNAGIARNAEQINSASNKPYIKLPCRIEVGGITQLVGFARLKEATAEGYQYTFFGDNVDWFDLLEGKSLRDIDLSEFNHDWTYANVLASASRTWSDGYLYPAINYGKLDTRSYEAGLSFDELYPAVFVKMLLLKILNDIGYSILGEYIAMRILEKQIVTIDAPFEYDDDFVKARSSKVGNRSGYHLAGTSDQTVQIPYNNDSDLPFFDGAANCYNTTDYSYTATSYMYVQANANLYVEVRRTQVGGFKGVIYVYKNGVPVGNTRTNFRGGSAAAAHYKPYNLSVQLQGLYLVPGDVLTVGVEFNKFTTGPGSWNYRFTMDDRSVFEVTPMTLFPINAEVELSKWLPDISQQDFIRTLTNQACLLFIANPVQKTVRIDLFEKVNAQKSMATDWSHKIDHSKRPTLKYIFNDYGQASLLKYAYDEANNVAEGYGDGTLIVKNEHLDKSKDMFESVFAATPDLSTFRSSTYTLPSLPIFTAKENTRFSIWSENDTYSTTPIQDYVVSFADPVGPRYFRALINGIESDKPPIFFEDGVWKLNFGEWVEGNLVEFVDRALFTTSSIVPRLLMVTTEANSTPVRLLTPGTIDTYTDYVCNASFAELHFQDSLIPQFYDTLQQMLLNGTRMLVPLVRLNPLDVNQLDFTIPVYLQVTTADYHISGYFYKNIITQHKPGSGESCEIELLLLPSKTQGVALPLIDYASSEYSDNEYN